MALVTVKSGGKEKSRDLASQQDTISLILCLSVCLCICVHLIFKPHFHAHSLHVMSKMAIPNSRLTCLPIPEERECLSLS